MSSQFSTNKPDPWRLGTGRSAPGQGAALQSASPELL